MRKLIVLWALIVAPCPAAVVGQHYDLGGPCKNQPGLLVGREMNDAKKTGSWDRVIELQKQEVRAGCSIAYRWYALANILLEANRKTEAMKVLEEIDVRGFEVSPTSVETSWPQVKTFLQDAMFKTSPLGVRIEQLKKISDGRRARFRATLRATPPSRRPPENYIARSACPFECCRYGDWTVLEDTDLVAAPGSEKVVGKARKGTRAVGLTGEVHLKPEPVVVLHAGDLPRDSIAFVLDYLGEGVGNVYTRGRVTEVPLNYAEYCFHPSESCWGETLLPPGEIKKPIWWVKIQLRNGVRGWIDKADRFGNKDACG